MEHWALILAAHASTDFSNTSNTTYLWVGIVIGVGGFLIGAYKLIRQSGADAARLETRLSAIEKAIKPNGKDTQRIGDIAARSEESLERVEGKLDSLASKLDQHIGSSETAHRAMWREINQKQDRT